MRNTEHFSPTLTGHSANNGSLYGATNFYLRPLWLPHPACNLCAPVLACYCYIGGFQNAARLGHCTHGAPLDVQLNSVVGPTKLFGNVTAALFSSLTHICLSPCSLYSPTSPQLPLLSAGFAAPHLPAHLRVSSCCFWASSKALCLSLWGRFPPCLPVPLAPTL